MSDEQRQERPLSIDRLPTLTEVVDLGHGHGLLADFDPYSFSGLVAVPPPATLVPAPSFTSALPLPLAPAPAPAPMPMPGPAALPPSGLPGPLPTLTVAVSPLISGEPLVNQVLRELAPRIDTMLEARLRAALAPALARAADGLIRDARDELSTTLRDLVEEAVARALARHDGR